MRGLLVTTFAIVASLTPLSLGAEAPRDSRALDDRLGDVDTDVVPVGAYSVHEWGVWQLDARGRVRSLEDVARESPPFVHRLRGVPAATPELPALPAQRGFEVYDKPVVFFYADAPLDVTMTVRSPGGRPWLYYPSASVGRDVGALALRFTGRLLASTPLPEGVRYPEPPNGHWWSYLRGVGASPFVASDTREAERFIFYDGQGPFPRGFTRRRGALVPIAGAVEPAAWLVENNTLTRLAISGTTITRTPLGTVSRILDELRGALMAHGLSGPESDSLIQTWRTELGNGGGKRVIWLLPRAAYDAMLPIALTPAPRELVRVGVVIEQL